MLCCYVLINDIEWLSLENITMTVSYGGVIWYSLLNSKQYILVPRKKLPLVRGLVYLEDFKERQCLCHFSVFLNWFVFQNHTMFNGEFKEEGLTRVPLKTLATLLQCYTVVTLIWGDGYATLVNKNSWYRFQTIHFL